MATSGSHGAFLWDLEGDLSKPVKYFPAYVIVMEEDFRSYGIGEVKRLGWDKNSTVLYMQMQHHVLKQDINKGAPFGINHERNLPQSNLMIPEGSSQSTNWDPYREDLLKSPDGSKYISVDRAGIHLWSTETKTIIQTIAGYFRDDRVAFMNGGETIAAVSGHDASIWDANSFELLRTFPIVPESQINFGYNVRFSRSKSYIAAVSRYPALVQINDVNTGEMVKRIETHTSGQVAAFSQDQQKAFIIIQPHNRLLNLNTWQYDVEFEMTDRPFYPTTQFYHHAVFSPDDSVIAAVHREDREIWVDILDASAGLWLKTITAEYRNTAWNDIYLYFSQDGKKLMVAQNTIAQVFDFDSGEIIRVFEYPVEDNDLVQTYIPNEDLSKIALSFNSKLERWDMEHQTLLCRFEVGGTIRNNVPISKQGLSILINRSRGTFIFDVNQCKEIKQIQPIGISPVSNQSDTFSADEQWYLGLNHVEMFWFHIPTDRIIQRFLSNSMGNQTSIMLNEQLDYFYIGRYDGSIVKWNLPAQSKVTDWLKLN